MATMQWVHLSSSPLMLLLILSVGGTRATLCPDGTAGLTKELYAASLVANSSDTYAHVTCIPEDEFNAFSGDVILNGLQHLTSIETKAFYGFKGKLVVKGEYPSLKEIAYAAFMNVNSQRPHNSVANWACEVLFELGLPALVTIGSQAFRYFTGTVSFAGTFPFLKSIGNIAFDTAGKGKGTNSKIDFGAG